jgi:hypothetical protein
MDLYQIVTDAIDGLVLTIAELLPVTPLQHVSFGDASVYLHWLNWFVPFDIVIPMFGVWLGLLAATLIVRSVLTYFGLLK